MTVVMNRYLNYLGKKEEIERVKWGLIFAYLSNDLLQHKHSFFVPDYSSNYEES